MAAATESCGGERLGPSSAPVLPPTQSCNSSSQSPPWLASPTSKPAPSPFLHLANSYSAAKAQGKGPLLQEAFSLGQHLPSQPLAPTADTVCILCSQAPSRQGQTPSGGLAGDAHQTEPLETLICRGPGWTGELPGTGAGSSGLHSVRHRAPQFVNSLARPLEMGDALQEPRRRGGPTQYLLSSGTTPAAHPHGPEPPGFHPTCEPTPQAHPPQNPSYPHPMSYDCEGNIRRTGFLTSLCHISMANPLRLGERGVCSSPEHRPSADGAHPHHLTAVFSLLFTASHMLNID